MYVHIEMCVCVCMGGWVISFAPECADKLVKWGVVPSGTLKRCFLVSFPSDIIILPSFSHS